LSALKAIKLKFGYKINLQRPLEVNVFIA